MRIGMLIAVATIGWLGSNQVLIGQAPASWFGTWELDAQSANPRRATPYKRVILTVEPREDDGLKVTYDMVGTRGGTSHMEWTGAFDGSDYPVQGVDYVLTNAYSRVGDPGYSIVVKVDGAVRATTRVTLSPDRNRLTTVTTEKDASGRTVESTAVYDRR
jgi:hypothetical protein